MAREDLDGKENLRLVHRVDQKWADDLLVEKELPLTWKSTLLSQIENFWEGL